MAVVLYGYSLGWEIEALCPRKAGVARRRKVVGFVRECVFLSFFRS